MMGLGLLAANAFATAEEDEEPWFGITGTGSADARENARMRANGWMPYSFKMGNTYFSYKEGPLAIGAAIIGSAFDAWKYNTDQNAYTKMTYALARIPDALLDNSFLSSGINLFEILGDPSDKGKVEKMARFTQRVITSPVPNLFRQLERLYEDRSFTSDTYYGGLMKNIPVVSSIAAANGMVRPRLNALGEDIHLGNPSISLSIAKGAASGMGLIEDESTKTGWLASISSQDPAWAKISRLDLKVPLTRPSELKFFGLDMTDDEKYTFSKIKGGLMKNLVNGIDFEKYSPEVRAYIINRYNRKYNLALQNYLLMERLGKEG
jgi:hypothetical protein